MKSMRHTAILRIISEQEIETQDDLIAKLKENGFDVTQATVSRDIKQLGLVKTTDGEGKYRYSAPHPSSSGSDSKFKNILSEAIISSESAENMVVVKTYSGMANAAAAAIDALASDRILGSIAGDDTILIVTKNDETAEEFSEILKDAVKLA
ncbi:MAG: arginine repressor [Eubacterium sp.]|nr:arginine repressor [Eubacterium sp.]CDE17841.1 arginine repressor [Eubacterium sp. CAG:841]